MILSPYGAALVPQWSALTQHWCRIVLHRCCIDSLLGVEQVARTHFSEKSVDFHLFQRQIGKLETMTTHF